MLTPPKVPSFICTVAVEAACSGSGRGRYSAPCLLLSAPSMSGSRSATRSPRLAPSWLRQDDLDLQTCFAEEPPAQEALAEAAVAPWHGYPRLPAAGDSSGFLRWCLLAREQPPGLARRWKWTSAERDAALAGMMSLCCEPLASAASSGSAQRAAEAEGEAGDVAQASDAAEAAADETAAPNVDPSDSEEEFESARDEIDGVRDEEQKVAKCRCPDAQILDRGWR